VNLRRLLDPRQRSTLTILVAGEHARAVERFRIDLGRLRLLLAAAALLALVGVMLGGQYLTLLTAARDNRVLRAENERLRTLAVAGQERLLAAESVVDRLERLDARLRASAVLAPARRLAIGPVGGDLEPAPGTGGPAVAASSDPGSLPGRLESLAREAVHEELQLRQLQEYLDDQQSLLAATPSIWPTHGSITSEFGSRLDPYTGARETHLALDIGSPNGQAVLAPADGMVVFTGIEGGYGNVLVIDHGYGVKTRYGHLSTIEVRPGQRVHRADVVASVGSTGLSTGPHLHYEVRVGGVPENPRKFILE
jgi:murein DD-endopeptidase MepM/ murein hydrolase activator NlpD